MKWLVRAESCAGGVCLWTCSALHEAAELAARIEKNRVLAGKYPEFTRISIHQLQDGDDWKDWKRIRINPPMEDSHA